MKPDQFVFTQKQNHNPFRPSQKSKSLATVRQLITQLDLSNKPRAQSQRKRQVVLDRQQIRKQMKNKWRDPGYCNLQFSNYKALKGKFLNQWELERIYLATRSYQAPKNFKGFKQCTQSRQFPKVSNDMYSQKFQQYIKSIEQQNENHLFSPKKVHTEASTTTYRNTMQFEKQRERKFNAYSTKGKSFGMGTVLWKTGHSGSRFKSVEDN